MSRLEEKLKDIILESQAMVEILSQTDESGKNSGKSDSNHRRFTLRKICLRKNLYADIAVSGSQPR